MKVMKVRLPIYIPVDRGVTWSVKETDASANHNVYILHNLTEWQARAIAAILRDRKVEY